ncbi:hypothetical protein EZV62_012310 [Acer yangbiense]|uniref:Ionotropic glutamate receptor C-terminal domain-containing protein n=1 Tax=Acer yangbiense TaxID=1000413 RepID=A0A5C7HV28_9ROSI|nr:hypothetical protein EZV62_012310 [Acer yangbiense]
MTASLGSKLFTQANKAGMMSEGYAWIVTEGLSTLMDPIGPKVMEGVLGSRPSIPKSKKIKNLKTISKGGNGLNQFGLWAYDTVWAVAMAVEKASAGGIANSSFLKPNTSKTSSSVDLASLGKSEMGHKLVHILLNTTFEGLSGKFHLLKGQLEPSAFEIFNVIGETERIIGNQSGPGRIGVPVREGFKEWTNNHSKPKFSGYSIEVFMAILQVLEFPLPYEFILYGENRKIKGSYNDLLHQITEQIFDAVVGDTTIVANRSTFVDFTLAYSESGVSMVVLVKDDEKNNYWIFLKPFSWDLWLTTGLAFMFTGLVVWVLQISEVPEIIKLAPYFGSPSQHWSLLTCSDSSLGLPTSRRYKAMITLWDTRRILSTKQLNFDESKLKPYSTEEYHQALSNATVAAIFDEKLFLGKANNCSKYMMIGDQLKEPDGSSFAFPQASPLASLFHL